MTTNQIPPSESENQLIPKEEFPSSSTAFQALSEGGFLTSKEKSVWEWFIFVITFQWIGAIFSTVKEHKERETLIAELSKTLNLNYSGLSYIELKNLHKLVNQVPSIKNYLQSCDSQKIQQILITPNKTLFVFQLFDKTQEILHRRIQKEEANTITQWMLETATDEWLKSYNQFLTNPFPSSPNPTEVTQLIKELIQDITFERTGEGEPSKAPFALQIEKRGDRLHIKDPITQETRTVESANWEVNKKQIVNSFAQIPQPTGSISEQALKKDWLSKGNVYLVHHNQRKYLALCPRTLELDRTAFMDKKPIRDAVKCISEKKLGTLQMPIAGSQPEDVQLEVNQDSSQCTVTLTYKKFKYPIAYPLKESETLSANRLMSESILEKDLLLARSYFVNELLKEEKT